MSKHRTALGVVGVALVFVMVHGGAAQQKSKPTKKKRPNPAMAKITDDPALPRVLLIGDSISIGYTLPTRELLDDKANLHRIPTNGGPTIRGLAEIDRWLGDGRWDVIHFNWGLHDLRQDEPGKHQVPIGAYGKNLQALVDRLQKTGATLIWASTTPVPKGAGRRTPGDEQIYNAVAERIMKENGITIDDLYAFALPRLEKIQLEVNVHFSRDGSAILAQQVARSIEKALKDRASATQ